MEYIGRINSHYKTRKELKQAIQSHYKNFVKQYTSSLIVNVHDLGNIGNIGRSFFF